MRSDRALLMLAFAPLGLAVGTGACNLILGDHQIHGEDRICSDDSDCDGDEICTENESRCREKCRRDDDAGTQCLQEGLPDFRTCTSDKTCTEPIGTPCDYDDYESDSLYCGGYEATCTNEDSQENEVPGYCTGACAETLPRCPSGFQCGTSGTSGNCLRCPGGVCAAP